MSIDDIEAEVPPSLRRSIGGWTMTKAKRPIPASLEAWPVEIATAYRDARDAIPFGPVVGEPFGETELFHLAPTVALKMRGLPRTARRLARATEAALARDRKSVV